MQVVLCVQASDMRGNQINKYKNLPGPEFPCQKSDAMMKPPPKNLPGPEFPCHNSDAMMKTPQKNLPGPEFPCHKSDAMMKTPPKNLPGPEFPCHKSDVMMKTPQIYQPSLISVLYSVSLGNTFQFKSWIACTGGSGDS